MNAIVKASEVKTCSKCELEKSINDFSKNRSRPDGYAHYCKTCAHEAHGAWKKNHPTTYRALKRKGYANNPERERGRAKEKRLRNPETEKQWHQRRRQEHPMKMHAVNAVNRAIAAGSLPHISTKQCSSCGNQAYHYHHHSYEQNHWLDVIPLCRSCHRLIHTGTLQLETQR